MEKAEIRKRILKLRERLSRKTVLGNSANILKKLLKLEEFQNAEKIMFYLDFKNEVVTNRMINKAFGLKKQVFVPRVVNNKLVPVQIGNLKNMVLGKFGILEPSVIRPLRLSRKAGRNSRFSEASHLSSARSAEAETRRVIGDMDVVIVPGVVFDRKCNRVGWGKGYYDRFLRNINVTKIGLAHGFQVVNRISAKKNDVSMDFVVTEKEVLVRRK
ncbi:MAG: 5-formyltetrahydrofolate cyclo-ligase [Elusimicrobia bacterium]|nr:5-formyltetrahydrofolate cyclo-ligase [Elusimicrobiota bacterium]